MDIVLVCGLAIGLAAPAWTQDEEAAAAQPEGSAQVDPLDEAFVLGPFSQPIEITEFVSYVAETLGINISRDAALSGQVAFNAGVEITKRDLLPLLDARLEDLGYTIVLDAMGFYSIKKLADVRINPGDEPGATTRFIATPGVRPSSLQRLIATQLGIALQPGNQGAGGAKISYEDELGVIVMTDSPRRIAAVESLVEAFLTQRATLVTETIELEYISAPQAKARAKQLLTAEAESRSIFNQINQGVDPSTIGQSQSGSGSLANRLTVDPSGNNLIFRGLPEELDEIRSVIRAVDRPSELVARRYFTGTSTRAIAEYASKSGFGEVDFAATGAASQQADTLRAIQQQQQFPGFEQEEEITGGARILADEGRGVIIYFATEMLHQQFEDLVEDLGAEDEEIVVQTYKLEYADAEDVADILQALIERTRPQTEASTFLPGGQNQNVSVIRPQQAQGDGSDADPSSPQGFNPTPDNSFVIADPANNQVVITAPRQQQEEFGQLIRRIDLRRSQVYIEATIVAVSDTDAFRLAIEQQFLDLNGDGEGGGVRTNFGLSTLDAFTNSTAVATGLPGVTAALIDDDYIPLIITATQRDSNARVVATPQLLVDDNSEATVLTSQEVPYQTTIASDISERTTFEFVTAETSLTVTPQISLGGTIRLDYSILLESFTGTALEGAPPPKQTNEITGESVTVPSDSTVVIGGLVIDSDSETVVRVPLLGDIPLVGHLFRDTREDGSKTTLYVFLKPRVLLEPTLNDYRLLTEGPQAVSGLTTDIPEFPPIMMSSTFSAPSGEPAPSLDNSGPRIGLPSETNPGIDQRQLRRDEE